MVGMTEAQGLDAVSAELYGGAPADFVARRDELAKQARADGDRELATAIKALRRPTVGAWYLNLAAAAGLTSLRELLDLGGSCARPRPPATSPRCVTWPHGGAPWSPGCCATSPRTLRRWASRRPVAGWTRSAPPSAQRWPTRPWTSRCEPDASTGRTQLRRLRRGGHGVAAPAPTASGRSKDIAEEGRSAQRRSSSPPPGGSWRRPSASGRRSSPAARRRAPASGPPASASRASNPNSTGRATPSPKAEDEATAPEGTGRSPHGHHRAGPQGARPGRSGLRWGRRDLHHHRKAAEGRQFDGEPAEVVHVVHLASRAQVDHPARRECARTAPVPMTFSGPKFSAVICTTPVSSRFTSTSMLLLDTSGTSMRVPVAMP